jgi:MarR family transcriptional regulator, organic hydroperoxide resistance regulator
MPGENDVTPEEVLKLIFSYSYALQKGAFMEWWGLELTLAQVKVLFTLAIEDHVAIGKIAENLGIGQPTASHLVDRLVQAGLAERVENPSDRRYTLAQLTIAGRELTQRLRQGRLERIQSWLSQLNQEDLDALYQGLKAILHVAQVEDRPGAAMPSAEK